MTAEEIYQLERPHPDLWKLYLARAILSGPGIIVTLPYLYFRYRTLRYRFDEEGIHARWGILFRREINLAYARIQDIHLTSGFIQRWLGLADVQVQTASGSATPELVIEGFKQFEAIRDFLYTRMRGSRKTGVVERPAAGTVGVASASELVDALGQVRDALHATREAIKKFQHQNIIPPSPPA
ncbi:MAG: PH domain-containing protein [Verrucomicrobiales bacterium]